MLSSMPIFEIISQKRFPIDVHMLRVLVDEEQRNALFDNIISNPHC